MKQKNSFSLFAVAATLVVLTLAAAVLDASAAGPSRGWRSTRYGRSGAEIWVELPRVAFPTGAGYKSEYDVAEGNGFGFGLMWGISDNMAVEGRMLQTNHTAGTGEEQSDWDLDIIKAGARFTFFEKYRLQPFVGAGWAHLTLERDTGVNASDSFERLTGYGAYITMGVDYIHNSSWSAFFRADYTHGGYGHRTFGLEEDAIDKPISGNCAAVAVGVAYRIPSW